jgi:hypothetical protein
MKANKVTKKTLPLVWVHLTAHVSEILEESDEATRAFCLDLDEFLNNLLEQDAFGTEGQSDPRGDHRR